MKILVSIWKVQKFLHMETRGAAQCNAVPQLIKLVWSKFVLEIQTTALDTPFTWLRAGPVNSLITTPGMEPP